MFVARIQWCPMWKAPRCTHVFRGVSYTPLVLIVRSHLSLWEWHIDGPGEDRQRRWDAQSDLTRRLLVKFTFNFLHSYGVFLPYLSRPIINKVDVVNTWGSSYSPLSTPFRRCLPRLPCISNPTSSHIDLRYSQLPLGSTNLIEATSHHFISNTSKITIIVRILS